MALHLGRFSTLLLAAAGLAWPTLGPAQPPLAGTFCHHRAHSGPSGAYSYTAWASFDGQGGFTYGSVQRSSGDAGSACVRDESPDYRGRYEVLGDAVALRFQDGSTDEATVHFRQPDGRVTELIYEGKLYAPQFCD